ncbi:unnamed protein product [Coffea canephora]|uniref:DUF538 domain-containing protein n=1 Tax=Coffea canephora TaxID=49390 RepID=A0A068VA07_COFCA|nr:unnamed protein product [Coffea canephora]
MTMVSSSKLQFLLLFFLFLTSFSLSIKNSVPDVHDLFPKYHLPKGLLPGNVQSYSLSSEDNTFIIELTHHCYVQFKDQLVLYDKVLTGKLGYGKVSDVTGIHARKFFIWVSVTGMDVDESSNTIEFHVGVLSQSLPADMFQTIPTCQNKGLQESSLLSSI